ncbi:MAG: hypothetical protein WCP06_06130 [Verrucomicrobiota bacterium]
MPYFILCFFGCLRAMGESIGVKFEDIYLGDAEMVLPASVSKVHQERCIDIRDCLVAWLSAWLEYHPTIQSGPILPDWCSYITLSKRRTILALIIGLDSWKPNGARKSCATFLERLTNPKETAKQLGNSEVILERNYLRASRRTAAKEYFSIPPPWYPPGLGRAHLVPEFERLARSTDQAASLLVGIFDPPEQGLDAQP